MIPARDDYNRIQDPAGLIGADEPVMLFRAQDKLFVPLLVAYAAMLDGAGAADNVREAVLAHINLAEEWQEAHPTKLPDLPTPAP